MRSAFKLPAVRIARFYCSSRRRRLAGARVLALGAAGSCPVLVRRKVRQLAQALPDLVRHAPHVADKAPCVQISLERRGSATLASATARDLS